MEIPGVTQTLLIDVAEGVATVTFNRPHVLNAIDHEQRTNLMLAFPALDADPKVRAIVLRGEGRAFCAGQDQREAAAMDAEGSRLRIEGYAAVYAAMRQVSKPVIARLHGYATGSGLQLALLSDLRIACSTTRIGMTELNVGSAAIMGSALLLPLVGEACMRRLVLTAEFVAAGEAREMNLVHEVLAPEDVDTRLSDLLRKLVARPPLGTALTKDWWRVMGQADFDRAMEHARVAHAQNFAAGGYSAGARKFKTSRDDA